MRKIEEEFLKVLSSPGLNSKRNKDNIIFETNIKSFFNMEDVYDILENNHLSPRDIQLFIDGNEINTFQSEFKAYPSSFQSRVKGLDYMSKTKMCKIIRDQAGSCKINSINRFSKKLNLLCYFLSTQLNREITMNLYYTPKNGRAFDRHRDPYDLFVLQCAGSKNWNISTDIDEVVESIEKFDSGDLVLKLKEGQILYLPCDTPHIASCDNQPSLHLTIGMHQVSTRGILEFLLSDYDEKAAPGISSDHSEMLNRINTALVHVKHKQVDKEILKNYFKSFYNIFPEKNIKDLI